MKKRTKALQVTPQVEQRVIDRDQGCIFTQKFGIPPHDGNIFDIAHVVNKSQGGLGIEENLVLACRYYHHLLDNGDGTYLREYAREYLSSIYPDWSEEKVTYSKWRF